MTFGKAILVVCILPTQCAYGRWKFPLPGGNGDLRKLFSGPTMSFDELPSEYDDEAIDIMIAMIARGPADVHDGARSLVCNRKRTVSIVKPDGGIIPSHTAIFTSRFVDLLARVINAQDAEGSGSNIRCPPRAQAEKEATFPIATSNKAVVKARGPGFRGRALNLSASII
jgi:hypothetical protein